MMALGPAADGMPLVGQVDPGAGRRARQPDRDAGREVVDPVDPAGVAEDPVEPTHLGAPARVDPRASGHLGAAVRAGPQPADQAPVAAAVAALQAHDPVDRKTVASLPPHRHADRLLVDHRVRPTDRDLAASAHEGDGHRARLVGGRVHVTGVRRPEDVVGRPAEHRGVDNRASLGIGEHGLDRAPGPGSTTLDHHLPAHDRGLVVMTQPDLEVGDRVGVRRLPGHGQPGVGRCGVGRGGQPEGQHDGDHWREGEPEAHGEDCASCPLV